MASIKAFSKRGRSDVVDSQQDALPDGIRRLSTFEVSRRKFVNGTVRIGLLAATGAGAIVGFTPEAARAAVACIPDTKQYLLPGNCKTSCIGPCNEDVSKCQYGTSSEQSFYCFNIISFDYPARAVTKCYGGAKSYLSFGCCVYC
jgi:hypothetical protein